MERAEEIVGRMITAAWTEQVYGFM